MMADSALRHHASARLLKGAVSPSPERELNTRAVGLNLGFRLAMDHEIAVGQCFYPKALY